MSWIFSFNKPPRQCSDNLSTVDVSDLVLAYAYNNKAWYRWASIAEEWFWEPYSTIPSKIKAEFILLDLEKKP